MKAQLIETRRLIAAGWVKNVMAIRVRESEQICYCLDGAIARACGGDLDDGLGEETPWYELLEKDEIASKCVNLVADVILGTEGSTDTRENVRVLYDFNDATFRSKATVLEVLDIAIAQCDEATP